MSMAYPGITHCSECGKRLDGWLGRCESCQQVKKDDKQAITDDKDTVQQVTGKLKIIDILNKIANGELKEGTKVKWRDNIYDSGYELFSDVSMVHLNDEVELIEPQEPKECEHEWKEYGVYNIITEENKHFRKCIKCDLEEEIKLTDNTKIEELDKEEMLYLTLQCAIAVLTDKLNEVIRYINKEDNNE